MKPIRYNLTSLFKEFFLCEIPFCYINFAIYLPMGVGPPSILMDRFRTTEKSLVYHCVTHYF